jgi:hypothetical protein
VNYSLLASVPALASPIPELLVLVTMVGLLALRTWSDVTGAMLHRRVTQFVTGSIVFFLILFVVLVVARFKSVG